MASESSKATEWHFIPFKTFQTSSEIVIQSQVNSHLGGTIEDGYRDEKAVTWVKEN